MDPSHGPSSPGGIHSYSILCIPLFLFLPFFSAKTNPFSDKVVSLFIHIMPPLVLHTICHLLPAEYSHVRYPALSETMSLSIWRAFWISSLVHTIWQGWYYIFIMVRRKEKIAAGRPTSFTWLRRSYAKTRIGKWVNSLPNPIQPFSFMGIQVTSCPATHSHHSMDTRY